MKPNVLITNAVPAEVLEPLTDLAMIIQGPSGGDLMPRSEVLSLGPSLDGIINQGELQVDREILDACPNLRIVANVAVGFDNLDPDLMAERGVWAVNAPGIFEEPAADCAVGSLLCLLRRINDGDRYIRSGSWRGFQPGVWDGVSLQDKRVGLIGYGRMGKAVARRLKAFGARIRFFNQGGSEDPAYQPLDQLLAESDIVSLQIPHNKSTHHLLNRKRLERMKPGAFLVNFARGKVVDQEAMIERLQSGALAGAALDVFEDEPAVPEILYGMQNVILTPHIGGGTHESRFAARRLCAENVALVLQGLSPKTPVNQPVGSGG